MGPFGGGARVDVSVRIDTGSVLLETAIVVDRVVLSDIVAFGALLGRGGKIDLIPTGSASSCDVDTMCYGFGSPGRCGSRGGVGSRRYTYRS